METTTETTPVPKKKNQNLRRTLFMVAMALVGAFFGYFAVKLGIIPKTEAPKSYLFIWLLWFPLIFLLVIGVHEVGHLLMGLWVGFVFRFITVGPFMWEKKGGNIHFQWNKSVNSGGGLTLCLPRDTHRLTRRFMYFIAGGPLASLVLALLTLIPFFTLDIYASNPSFLTFSLASLVGGIGYLSSVIFLTTIIPARMGGFYSDGARFLTLARGGDRAFLETTLLATVARSIGKVRPRDQDTEMLQEAVRRNPEAYFTRYLYSYLHMAALDAGHTEEAARYLSRYAEGVYDMPTGYQAAVWLDKAFFEARFRKNPTLACQYLEKAKINPMISKVQVALAKTALALEEQRYEEARQEAEKGLEEIPNVLSQGNAIAEREWLEEMLAEARQYYSDQ